ncbi:hypothetical protein B0H14DRAFT_1220345 [Mycena olivaceomarginata]|nr:hypothetical protein B0H14DRAFT_1220345 [Mycena olivaceomarginata]
MIKTTIRPHMTVPDRQQDDLPSGPRAAEAGTLHHPRRVLFGSPPRHASTPTLIPTLDDPLVMLTWAAQIHRQCLFAPMYERYLTIGRPSSSIRLRRGRKPSSFFDVPGSDVQLSSAPVCTHALIPGSTTTSLRTLRRLHCMTPCYSIPARILSIQWESDLGVSLTRSQCLSAALPRYPSRVSGSPAPSSVPSQSSSSAHLQIVVRVDRSRAPALM